MKISFTKVEGLGNDFILIDDRNLAIQAYQPYPFLAERLCDRRCGIGGDGLIVFQNSETCDIKFSIYNSDGSQAQMCGNGMRCFAKYLFQNGVLKKTAFSVETLAGIITPQLNIDAHGHILSITVDMGKPVLTPANIPFISQSEQAVSEKVDTDSGAVSITAVSMGNPHAIIFVDHIADAPVSTLGPIIETHTRFPEKTNVEFIEIVSDTEINMRVWERGAGITQACGTGACAAVVAAVLNHRTQREVTVNLDGGTLFIAWDPATDHLLKTGPANIVFNGQITV